MKSSKNGTQIGKQNTADGKKSRFPLHRLATDLDLQLKRQRDLGKHSGVERIPLRLTDPILGADIVRLQNHQVHMAHDLRAVAVVAAPILNVNGAATENHEETTANAIGMIETVVAETKPEALSLALTAHASEKRKKTLLDGCLNQPVRAEAEL